MEDARMSRRLPLLAGLAGGALVTGLLAVTGVRRAARRTGISVEAWMVSQLAGFLAPDLAGPGKLAQAIDKDRLKGPSPPPRKMLQHIDFADETRAGCRVFRATPHAAAASDLRLIYLHGGAFVLDLLAVQWTLVDGLMRRVGAEVIAPIYPLAPEHGWEEGLGAVERLYLDVAAEVGASNVVIFGDSAGGGLALSLAQRLRDNGAPAPAALVLFSPWLDVSVTGADQPDIERRDPALSIGFLREAGELWAKDIPVSDPRVSPLFGDQSGLPPTIVFSGTRDVLDSDALRLAHANSSVEHQHYPEMIHVWPSAPTPEGRRALDEAAAFIRQHAAAAPL
jgi:monoterpene epsilon-lactone hydrolase